jgi:drug/metabolite transporter (DMT)-like permease
VRLPAAAVHIPSDFFPAAAYPAATARVTSFAAGSVAAQAQGKLMDTGKNPSRQALLGSVLILLGAIAFSAKAILIKIAYAASAPPDAVTLLTLRMMMALPVFLAVALWDRASSGQGHRTGGDWAALMVLGILGYYLASLLDFEGLEYISAGLERLILFLYPTIVVILTAALYRRPIGVPQRWALLLSYAGIALVYSRDPHLASSDTALGALLVFGSALSFAVYLTGSGHFIPRFGSRRFTAYSMSVACLAIIGQFLITRPIQQLLVSTWVVSIALALALVCTVTPAFLMNAGIRRIGADQAALIGTVGPVSTLVMAYLFLDETLLPIQFLGTAMVLGGVVLVTLRKRDPL